MARFINPLTEQVPDGISSCEHCRTVTWAGMPACGCELGQRVVDETTLRELLLQRAAG
ncbi:hypothetical protein [Georgenia sp. AZ-5]|uniref:hypothetical protein n=1 Tax=Georgenia sp. AZ-5 TaxID=3367526 RepID=UPI0037542B49